MRIDPTTGFAFLLPLALALLAPLPAHAAAGAEDAHLLSVGAGIASPSMTSALGENPAGLVFNHRFRFLAQAATENDDFSPIGVGGGLFAGNGSVGAGLTLLGFESGSMVLGWGLAAEIPGLDLSWGFTGSHVIAGSGQAVAAGSSFGLDTGILLNGKGKSRFGFTLFDVLDNIDAIGAGWAYDLSSAATFALDGAYGTGAKTIAIKPSLGIRLPGFHIASGYGFGVSGDGGNRIRDGVSLAVGIPFGKNFAIQAYYNQIARYYAGLTIAL